MPPRTNADRSPPGRRIATSIQLWEATLPATRVSAWQGRSMQNDVVSEPSHRTPCGEAMGGDAP